MLIMLRFASIILALVLLLSIIIAFGVIARNYIQGRFGKRKRKKSKIGDLPSDAGIRDLILASKIDEAIDLYQRFTGVDKFTARDAVEDMEREIRLSTFDKDLNYILGEHGKAAAIEAYQAGTGSDLAEALAYVENLEKA